MVQVSQKDWILNLNKDRPQIKKSRGVDTAPRTLYIGEYMMQTKTQKKPECAILTTKWLRRIGVTGLIFFFAKGLAWIIVAAWVVY